MQNIGIIGSEIEIGQVIPVLQKYSGLKISGYFNPAGESDPGLPDICRMDGLSELVRRSEAVIFLYNGTMLYELAKEAVKASRHVFIDNPSSISVKKITQLIDLAAEANIILKVKQTGRYNGIVNALWEQIKQSRYIEIKHVIVGHTVSSGRLFECIVEDIELITVIASNIKKIRPTSIWSSANGLQLINVRFEFDNQLVAALTWNVLSDKNVHQALFVHSDKTIEIDFLTQEAGIFHYSGNRHDRFIANSVRMEKIKSCKRDPFTGELSKFIEVIRPKSVYMLNPEEEFKAYLIAKDLLIRMKLEIAI